MSILWLDRAFFFFSSFFCLFFFFVAVTSAPPAKLSLQHQSITHYQRNRETHGPHHLSKVPHPTDRRGECHHIIPLHIFSTVIAASRLKEDKAHPHFVPMMFYQLAAGSALIRDKNWAKEVGLNIKLTTNFIKVLKILFLPISFLIHT